MVSIVMMVLSVVAFDVSDVVVFVVTMLPFDVVGVIGMIVSVVTSDVVGVLEDFVLTEGICMARNKYFTEFTTMGKCRTLKVLTIL